MASSGTFTSGRYGGGSYGPWLTLAWTQVSQSVANNTTTLDLTLRFHWDANISYTFRSRAGSVQGNSYTYSGSVSGTSGVRVLRTQRVTITHNSNGARSVTLSGNITSLGINWSGSNIGTMSVSGTANLNTIPRATTMSAFSFNAHLKNGTANQINYTIDRKSTAFRHRIQLRDGDTVLRTWDNIDSNASSTLALTATEVNTLLNRMSSSTTKSYVLVVATRSGNNGSFIGSAVSRNATATVHADVKPTVSAVTLSQTGNTLTTHTLQGFSKIKASFTRSAGYGATISSSSIQVRRRSGGADSQTISGNDGTTANAVSLNGVYEARGTTRDSRGRTNQTAWATITVTAYSAPSITNFSASRNGTTKTTVNISRTTTHTVLGTSNHLTYTIQRRQGTGAWTNVNTGATGTVTTSGATGSATSTGNSVTQSYDFRLVVTDKFGGRAESLQSVTTQRVVLDIHKNEGVGIGKIHERGDLDVNGNMYLDGFFSISNANAPGSEIRMVSSTASGNAGMELTSNKEGGVVYIDFNTVRDSSDDGIGDSRIRSTGGNPSEHLKGALELQSGIITFRADELKWKGDHIMNSGYNSNGYWVRYHDGTMIQRSNTIAFGSAQRPDGSPNAAGLYQSSRVDWTFPTNFHLNPTVIFGHSLGNFPMWFAPGYTYVGSSQGWIYSTQARTGTGSYWFTAVGRWKQ